MTQRDPGGDRLTTECNVCDLGDRQLVREIETQAIQAQQQISLTRTQMASKHREMRMTQLTLNEISSLSPSTNVYEGVGKMFVALPMPALKVKLGQQLKDLEGENEGLGKKLVYLETTAKNSQTHIDHMLGRAGET
ncbi:putative prefoldin subunit protein [Zalerion maritima]|uniref:Prefoldin subunit protein n=1 Tax=Zalerion maritima TaxID=339359 RepID=A0AAD5RNG9_9PEZI|nr:putative prefoldin subunit protein [Zalerion maritima]